MVQDQNKQQRQILNPWNTNGAEGQLEGDLSGGDPKMALLGSSLQGQLSGFQFLVHLDQDENQDTLHPLENQGCLGDRPKETPEVTPQGGSFQFFSFSVPPRSDRD